MTCIKKIKSNIDMWLENYFENKGTYNKKIYEAMNYSLNIGGKRIRPLLMILTYSMYKDNYKEIIPVAGAVEMIHTYSLIHDDLPCMDNDDLRRGKPTNHKVFGEAIALLAGDGLLSEAMNVIINYCSYKDIEAIEACKVIFNAAGTEGMVGGQTVDILSENKEISKEELQYMHKKKTGAIIKSSIIAGAILGKAPKKDINDLSLYGEKLGLAFQIRDDILDVIGTTEELGKQAKKDEIDEKTNYITVYGLEKCQYLCEKLTDECIDILNKIPKDTSKLKEITNTLLYRKK
ncbi:farnesyl diphosphate synthase [Clostridium acetireducens DSM 10703]|uniref:Farnesyl diphosphate synthase n=1 Tax=Clostridium acetireducens DSM 10703 TaxID=1121290 RepID=A0A1E8F1X0_9CLOT|nr:farnesyl diphosphate synthase [Clostridium acetireducens]OFI07600.1 farnesyl diphosphate synthase [Clostridium acetireducens DSM 10703]